MSRQMRKTKAIRSNIRRTPIVLLFLAVAIILTADHFYDWSLNGFDYAAIILVALFGLKGYIQGLINTIFSVLGYIIGAFAAVFLSSPTAAWILAHTDFGNGLSEKLEKISPALSRIPVATPEPASGMTSAMAWLQNTPTAAKAMEGQPLLQQVLETANPLLQNSKAFATDTISLNDWLVYSLLRIVAVFVLFALVKFILVLIGHLITSLMNISTVMSTGNRTAGMALGLLSGIVLVYILFTTLIPFFGALHIVKIPLAFSEAKTMFILDVILQWIGKVRG